MALRSWSISSVQPTGSVLVDSSTGTAAIVGMIISNPSNANAQVVVTIQDSSDNTKFNFFLDLLAGDSPFALDTKIIVSGGDKLVVASDNDAVCVYASGDQ